jgi:DNA-binding IclR family transcriptional regulator
MAGPVKETPGGAAAVDRALAILAAFDAGDEALPLADIARRTGLYKSTILRLAASLEHAGMLRRRADGRFALGPELLRLGRLYQRSFRLGDSVMPVLRRLAADSGESAAFYVRDGDERRCLYRVESAQPVRVWVQEGQSRPLARGAAGRVILAFSGPPDREGDAEAQRIRARRFAVSRGEVTADTAAIAAPVLGIGQQLVGALNLSGPSQRITPAVVERCVKLVLAAAAELTRTLGGTWDTTPARVANARSGR